MKRIAIIDNNKCRPSKCNFECGLICPINRQQKECVKLVDIEDMTTGNKKNMLK
jgi:translation initiation factor RLI1